MKLILSGSTGLVGTEVIRQSLLNPRITSLVALTRRPIDIAAIAAEIGGDKDVSVAKVKSVMLQDFTNYPEEVKNELADADACIWTLALTPMRSKQHPWNEVVRINKDYCVAGMNAIADARRAAGTKTPFRFMYMSGRGVSYDMKKKPWILGDYILMRSGVENEVRDFAASHANVGWQTCIARPGLISGFSGAVGMMKNATITAIGFVGHSVTVRDCAASMIKLCAEGLEKETLENEDMVRMGKE
ncbi:nucleoside-diphosphate-sugar epimeras-like protein [Lentithecium fluviatile CBS 122367]|uniref:Nucleoside-diphosphate-sugar epimeras-like protein n=1 Tax=Lentithecium fluviatile CBS 122367 TaxID=1168545 RepID=A0A6G1IM13_9PLEO|nr:nucleoside-diphosphate-sugar epimeras-like protein [Lentithecium fluviatile CBS 122367]